MKKPVKFPPRYIFVSGDDVVKSSAKALFVRQSSIAARTNSGNANKPQRFLSFEHDYSLFKITQEYFPRNGFHVFSTNLVVFSAIWTKDTIVSRNTLIRRTPIAPPIAVTNKLSVPSNGVVIT